MKLSDLAADNRNANKGTKKGRKLVQQSLKDYGAGRSILLDRDGRIIAGNKTSEAAAALGMEDVIVVPTDGSKVVAVQRTDLSLDDPKARELAIADNRASEIGLDWDSDVLKSLDSEVDLHKFFDDKELQRMFGDPGDESQQLPEGFGVLIENITEQQQLELLERLSAEGYSVKAMTF